MANKIVVAPSVLAADFARLGEEAAAVAKAGADWLHVDVMDNRFVPNLSFGAVVAAALGRACALPLDVHVMAYDVEALVAPFAAAGARRMTFHPESAPDADRVAAAIADAGMRVGVALNPATPLSAVEELLHRVDLLLVMTVHPGFGGQAFLPAALAKIARARRWLDEVGCGAYLQVDGGINVETGCRCVAAGADALVAGSAVFSQPDYAAAIRALRGAAA